MRKKNEANKVLLLGDAPPTLRRSRTRDEVAMAELEKEAQEAERWRATHDACARRPRTAPGAKQKKAATKKAATKKKKAATKKGKKKKNKAAAGKLPPISSRG